jgi:hypothetical protein
MLRFWNPLLLRFLRRDPGEIERRAAGFAIRGEHGRGLVARLGQAFLGGYNAMLELPSLERVSEAAAQVEPHFRPFFFEGAAMGYLPRGYLSSGFRLQSAERDLLQMDPGYRYLYYVGLGFWMAMRHPGQADAIESLGPHLDPMYVPLCYDGFGFKVGFFDYPRHPERARALLGRVPVEHRRAAQQGFGRSLFFVFMEDETGFRRERDEVHRDLRMDREQGRSLALAFTGVDRPRGIEEYLEHAADETELSARLTGVTWALTAREMNDRAYFQRCMADATDGWRDLFLRLPGLCLQALQQSAHYSEWQERSRDAALAAYRMTQGARRAHRSA